MYFIYIAIIFFSGQMNPVSFAKKIGGVQLLAFSTSSTAAVLFQRLRGCNREAKGHPCVVGPFERHFFELSSETSVVFDNHSALCFPSILAL
jgi:L-cystine uptake protein TcyP (sodium:dicarboxylate symporter family)